MGTGSPKATTRGLEDTPYLGSTRPANLPEEAQLASARQRPAAATQRAARAAESARRIPIAPNTIAPVAAQSGAFTGSSLSMRPTSASTREDIATGTRRKWGEGFRGEPMVTRAFRRFTGEAAILLAPFETPVAENPRSLPIVRARPGIFLTVQACHRLLHMRGAQRTTAMFETMTAMMGLLGAGIFLAHAFEGLRSRA